MTKLDIERTELRSFSAEVQAGSARNLNLLRDIESTIASVERLAGHLRADTTFADKVNAGLSDFADVVDPDESIQSALLDAQEGVAELHQVLIQKRQSGRDDHRLTDEDGIEDVYSDAIAAAADLHNSLNSLRWNIGEHDIDVAGRKVGKEYSAENIDQLFDDILGS